MQSEFRERLERLSASCEQMMAAVRQMKMAEAESLTRKRVNPLEDRVDALENSDE
ncbi:MAG TPA: hypothetical protein VGO69_02460 [Pyrinomonadaceae bacterium]|jgi:hypothetical protein|nr:hypothetical protein [Pyrinomonadaceae bacterium]